MAELVDAPDSKSGAFGRSGSTPDIPTKKMKKIENTFRVSRLDYIEPLEVWKKFESFENVIFLDSAGEKSENNRYSYLAISPLCNFKFQNGKLYRDEIKITKNIRGYFKTLLKNCYHKKVKGVPNFQCGVSGYVTYDLCLNIENVKQITNEESDYPDLQFGLFDIVLAFDLKLKKAFLFSQNLDHLNISKARTAHTTRRKQILSRYKLSYIPRAQKTFGKLKWKQEISKKEYKSKIKIIKKYIDSGDIFQANFTHRFHSKNNKNLAHNNIYFNFREKTRTPFSSFLNFGSFTICSFSPERFMKLNNGIITTSPIKGTVRRSDDLTIDKKLREELILSEKNRAENLMIVDVLRNDISRVSKKGSVRVTELAKIKSYQNVHHLVSTIQGKIDRELDAVDLLFETLPGGSITGAPKIRAMEIISELEKNKRGVYCGAIGYISFSKDADFNIPIRTLTITDNNITINCGGGIVSDSDSNSEYQESIDKIANIIKEKKKKISKQSTSVSQK